MIQHNKTARSKATHTFVGGLRHLLGFEVGLLKRYPRLRLSIVGVLFVPALYALIYLSSVWDPASRTQALPVGIVNQDVGVEYRGQFANVGKLVGEALEKQANFGYRQLTDPEQARMMVREGTLAFAIIFPTDFSALAVPGGKAGAGKLIVYTSEGNNYTGAGFARRFAPELAHRVNETLNEKRWEMVLATASGSQESLKKLKDGVAALRSGAAELQAGMGKAAQGSGQLDSGLDQAERGGAGLQDGAGKLADGAAHLSDGMKQLGNGVRTMDAKKPTDVDLQTLKDGAHSLAAGHDALGKGLTQLDAGAKQLARGTGELKAKTAGIPIVGTKIAAGAGELEAGATQLTAGLDKAVSGESELAGGAAKLDGGVSRLTDGMSKLGAGLHEMAGKLPKDEQLDSFASGAAQLAQGASNLHGGLQRLHEGSHELATGMVKLDDGSVRIAGGLDLIDAALPSNIPGLDGSAAGLADSVTPVLEIAAPVPNNGSGFAPNFVPLALWVGVVVVGFMFHFRTIPQSLFSERKLALLIGKLVLPAVVVLGQAVVMLLMLVFLLGVTPSHWFEFVLTTLSASLTFLAVIMALVRLFGDTGKVLALILLILQLSSAGAVMPIELAGGFFRWLHPLLPFTWVVRAFRAALFDAFNGAWLSAWLTIIGFGVGAMLLAAFAGRWKPVPDAEYRPAMDV